MDYTTYEEIKKFIEENSLKEIDLKSHKGIHYIYVTEDLEKMKFYIGKRTCKVINAFEENYYGSSVIIKRIIKKNKLDSSNINQRLKKYILQTTKDKTENIEVEIGWIFFFNAVENTLFYNMSIGGKGGDSNNGNKMSDATKEKLRQANLGKVIPETTREKMRKARAGRAFSDESLKKMSEARKGWIYSEETKGKIKRTNTGKKHSEESIQKMKDNHPHNKHSEEAKEKIREANIGKKLSDETREKISRAGTGNKNAAGHKLSEEARKKIKLGNLGRKQTPEAIEKMKLNWKKNFFLKKTVYSIFLILLSENYK